MTTLVIAEHDNQQLLPVNAHLISAAAAFNKPIHVLVAGYQGESVAKAAAKLTGVNKVLHVDAQCYQHEIAENLSQLIVSMAKNYEAILAPATTFGKNSLPRVAALLDMAQISDVIEIKDEKTFIRPIYAGNVIATVEALDPIKILTIRATHFPAVTESAQAAQVEKLSTEFNSSQVKFINLERTKSERPELTSARVVISGGRGLQSAENFKMLEKLADQLNAAIGASRAAVDAGFVPNDYQVGQTGKIVAPDLYIAIGISGAIQHLAGMKDSKVIVAINKDPDAPIFQVSDFGLVGDLFQVIPQFEAELKKMA